MAESESPVVTVSFAREARASIALTIEARLVESFWVLRPRSWSETRLRRSPLANCDCSAMDEHVILKVRELGFEDLKGMGRRRHVAMEDGTTFFVKLKDGGCGVFQGVEVPNGQ